MKDNIYIFRPEWFSAYGLDKEKNFILSPECPCGCGGKALLLLKERQDLFGFAYEMLMENECQHCGIFAHCIDGSMYIFLKIEDETDESIMIMSIDETDMDFFHDLDEKIELHCIGLLIEVNYGQWKIIED